MYLREGAVKLTVVNTAGKEAVVEILGPGDFLGVRCLAGRSVYTATATAIVPTTVLVLRDSICLSDSGMHNNSCQADCLLLYSVVPDRSRKHVMDITDDARIRN